MLCIRKNFKRVNVLIRWKILRVDEIMAIKRMILLGILLSLFMYSLTAPLIVNAQGADEAADKGTAYLAMALATGLSSIAAGYAVAKTGTAALASVTEKPELFGRTILYVGLAEGIAIYGVLIALLIWITL